MYFAKALISEGRHQVPIIAFLTYLLRMYVKLTTYLCKSVSEVETLSKKDK